jgi:elongation factor P--beta-lysine ligase
MNIKTNISNLERYKIYLKIEEAVEEFLKKRGYLKLDLPVLSPALVPESYLEVFATDLIYHQKKEKLFLTPSPELFIKRLLAHGVGNCYYLGKSFRNHERNSDLHSHEFSILEFYKVKSDYLGIAEEVLTMLCHIAQAVNGRNDITYQGHKVSFDRWEKTSVVEAFEKYAHIIKGELFDKRTFLKKAEEKGYRVEAFTYEDLFSQIYVQEIEPNLGKDGYPTLIYDYPKEFAALAKLNPDATTAQRFEFYIAGIELGDCYTELTDWKEQGKRFDEEEKKREKGGRTHHPVDKGFIEALKYGLIDCAGIAIGFDRLAMIYANVTSIEQLKLININ